MKEKPFLVLVVNYAKFDFVVYLNDIPIYFYLHKRVDSEEFIPLNSYIQEGVNSIQIEPMNRLTSLSMLATIDYEFGRLVDGSFEGKRLDPRGFSQLPSRLELPKFNAPKEFAPLPWQNSPVIDKSNIHLINDYYLKIFNLYKDLKVEELVNEFAYAIKLKQAALPSRHPDSFKDLLEYGLELEKEDKNRQVLKPDITKAYRLIGNQRLAYTLDDKWFPTIGSIDAKEPNIYVGSLTLMIGIVKHRAMILGFE